MLTFKVLLFSWLSKLAFGRDIGDDNLTLSKKKVHASVRRLAQNRKEFTHRKANKFFLNPDRGFYNAASLVDETDLSWIPRAGQSLLFSYVRLDDYRDKDISDEYLDRIERGLKAARRAGIKVIVRVSYNFPGADYMNAKDAPLSRVLRHIEQLSPLFRSFGDVISVHQAGFIGAWGEWHTSSNNLTKRKNRQAILFALLDATNSDRMVQVRYPAYIMREFPNPIKGAQAYKETRHARTAFHNDCFLTGKFDTGTYDVGKKKEQKEYIAAMSKFAFVGGETCQNHQDEQRFDCPTATKEMKQFHYSFLNEQFYKPAIDQWKDEGCYQTIREKLGYRFRLKKTVVLEASPGSPMKVIMTMINEGWASPHNPRGVALILRHLQTNEETVLRLDNEEEEVDMRRWLPKPGQTKRLSVTWNLPQNMARGSYQLFIHFPDTSQTLEARAAYSIRLANRNMWEKQTGYNLIGEVRVRKQG